MTKDQARVLAIRGALAHLYYMPAPTWIPDWTFHKPENQEQLSEARDWVIYSLVGLLHSLEDLAEKSILAEESRVHP